MKAEIIAIGTEILLGHIVNTNTSYLSRQLAGLGIDVYHQSAVGDNPARLGQALIKSLNRSDMVITTGGLGPTVDDITLETIARAIGKNLVFKKEIFKRIKNNFKKRRCRMPKEARRQAFVPEGAVALRNDVGTAPGLIIESYNKIIIALPGPPRELTPIVERFVLPYLKKITPGAYTIKSRTLKLMGLAESQVNAKVKDLLKLSGDPTVGIYAHVGQVDLKITCKGKTKKETDKKIKKIENKIGRRFGKYVFGTDNETLEEVVGGLLTKKKKTLAIAESCSGGYISNLITNSPGSSKYFIMGVVAYNNKIKTNLLGINKEIIKKKGAVSKEVVSLLAKNIRSLACTDFGIGVTGIAGPAGGSKNKPIGTVYIAISSAKRTVAKRFFFIGTRQEIKLQTAQQALHLLRLSLI